MTEREYRDLSNAIITLFLQEVMNESDKESLLNKLDKMYEDDRID